MNLNVKDTLKKGISKIAVIFYSHYKMSSGCQLKSLFDTCQNIYIIVTNLQSDAVHSFRLSVSVGGLPHRHFSFRICKSMSCYGFVVEGDCARSTE